MLRASFRQLQTFVLVTEAGSFAAAAVRLGISPEAVGEQIRTLERKFGQTLFDRRPGTVPILNENGSALLRRVPMLLETAQEVADLSKVFRSDTIHKVRVGGGPYILDRILLPNLPLFQLDHPQTHIEFVHLPNRQEALQKTASSQVDLAYAAVSDIIAAPGVECIGISKVSLVASPDHPVIKQGPHTSIDSLPMLMPLAGSLHERHLIQALSELGITKFNVVTRAQHHETLIHLAESGLGVACVLEEHAIAALKSGQLAVLPLHIPPLYRHAFRRPGALEVEHLKQFDEFALKILTSPS